MVWGHFADNTHPLFIQLVLWMGTFASGGVFFAMWWGSGRVKQSAVHAEIYIRHGKEPKSYVIFVDVLKGSEKTSHAETSAILQTACGAGRCESGEQVTPRFSHKSKNITVNTQTVNNKHLIWCQFGRGSHMKGQQKETLENVFFFKWPHNWIQRCIIMWLMTIGGFFFLESAKHQILTFFWIRRKRNKKSGRASGKISDDFYLHASLHTEKHLLNKLCVFIA